MPSKLGKYTLVRTLGSGAYSKVKLAQDSETGLYYAIKIMKGAEEEKNRKMIENVISEVQTMSQFKKEDHPFIVNLIEYDKDGIIEKQDGSKRQELFDFVASTGAFPEHVARYYFRQLMEGLDSVHRKGITHRDLKPENLLYDGDFNLKIADFGFAAPMGGRDGSSL
jgi:serine/threonine protein kinase